MRSAKCENSPDALVGVIQYYDLTQESSIVQGAQMGRSLVSLPRRTTSGCHSSEWHLVTEQPRQCLD